MRRLLITAAAAAFVAGLIVVPTGAEAAKSSKYLWATINICDTLKHPDQMGVRASMPGDGTYKRMYIRFRAQFYDAAKKQYHDVQGSGLSGWIYAGSARYKFRQAGFTFSFDTPAPGAGFKLRGVVSFEWRKKKNHHWVVVRKATKVTTGGRAGVHGADPPGYSSGTCQIS
ncbi:MAG: hypothetical protein ACJ76V_08170 [Thermoleophilaceae bacterium]